MRRLLHVLSAALGVFAAVLTGVFAVFIFSDWLKYETYRLPPVPQVAYFFGLILFALLGTALLALALRTGTGNRAAAMIAISGALAINGAISSAAGRLTAVWLFYAGALGLVAGLVALAEVPRQAWLGLVGILGAVLLFSAVTGLHQLVARLFP